MKHFNVQYLVTCYEDENIDEKLRWICLEQSVELPGELVPQKIMDEVVGQVTAVERIEDRKFEATISWPVENMGYDRTQFLNILYGNISLKKGIKVTSVDWHPLEEFFQGPMFGIEGIREEFGILNRPMACGVLKPMGLLAEELAEQAKQFAFGGIDMIKDDHGLANQVYAPFDKRVLMISDALMRVFNKTGKLVRYFPNITCSGSQMIRQYEDASDCGADGVLIIPELCGYEAMLELAEYDLDLPIIAHPAFSGTFVNDPEHGFTPAFLYGELYRAFGADFTIYPNTGGRFSFTPRECHELNEAARNLKLPFKRTFPMPGGGMELETIPHWIQQYGNDTVFLLGASILQHPGGIQKASEEIQNALGDN